TSSPYGKGLLPYDENNEPVPLFEEGYEPDLFFETKEGLEAPAYGPFEGIVSDDGFFLLDVQDLNYISGDVGSIPKGYYEFVYFGWDLKNNNFTGKLPAGKLELRLEATDHSTTSPDVIYVDRDVVSREVIHTVSHDYVGAGTSSGCSSVGISAAGIVLLAGIAFVSKKRS
ncbi:MAG: hypothetical protein IJ587_01615, partial [Synergistaceae bacterium]|nr:hypothetical protein [Synergistaceae bacterium]